jgi:NAD(P)-dependent dehydrogenase (short-subunit alcohol dehydrogenase family)/acyl carrier protein
MQAVLDDDLEYPEKATLLGPCKVIPREYPDMICRSIDIKSAGDLRQKWLIGHLLDEILSDSTAMEVAYRGRQRWVRTFERMPLRTKPIPRLRERGVYLITGGLGGVGLTMAQYLAETQCARLVLIRRSPFPRREDWPQWLTSYGPDDENSRIIAKLQAMEAAGASVLVLNADVAHRDEMNKATDIALEQFGRIDGVIHAAGLAPSGIIADITPEQVRQVLAPKVTGSLVLAEIFGEVPLDFMMLFSSTSAILGNVGFVDYVAANVFMDAFAHHKSVETETFTVSINWDGFREVGMAVQVGADKPLQENTLTNAEAVFAFQTVLDSGNSSQIVVSTLDLGRMLSEIENFHQQVIHQLDGRVPATLDSQAPSVDAAEAVTVDQVVHDFWAECLGFKDFGDHDNFAELGGDSLVGTMLAARIRKHFQIKFSAAAVQDMPSVAEQAAYIRTQIGASERSPQAGRPPEAGYVAPSGDMQTLLAELWQGVLKVDRVSQKDYFTRLGGSNGHAVELARVVEDRLGLAIAAQVFIDEDSFLAQADMLETLCWTAAGLPSDSSPGDRSETAHEEFKI